MCEVKLTSGGAKIGLELQCLDVYLRMKSLLVKELGKALVQHGDFPLVQVVTRNHGKFALVNASLKHFNIARPFLRAQGSCNYTQLLYAAWFINAVSPHRLRRLTPSLERCFERCLTPSLNSMAEHRYQSSLEGIIDFAQVPLFANPDERARAVARSYHILHHFAVIEENNAAKPYPWRLYRPLRF